MLLIDKEKWILTALILTCFLLVSLVLGPLVSWAILGNLGNPGSPYQQIKIFVLFLSGPILISIIIVVWYLKGQHRKKYVAYLFIIPLIYLGIEFLTSFPSPFLYGAIETFLLLCMCMLVILIFPENQVDPSTLPIFDRSSD